jgi:hypothetical protein
MKTTNYKISSSFYTLWLSSMLSVSILLPQLLNAQGGVGIGIDNPHQSAILHIESPANNRGLLIPRLTRDQIISMQANATEALLLYDTTNQIFIARINGEWRSLNALVSNGLSTSDAYINTTGLIGLGAAPVAGGAKVQVAGSISAASFIGEGVVPAGGIIMWSGAINSIPNGWTLCDGKPGTPDLRERFIVGASGTDNPSVAGAAYPVQAVGGLNEVALTEAQMPSHTHTFEGSGDNVMDNIANGNGQFRNNNDQPGTYTGRMNRTGGVYVAPVMGVDNSGFPCTDPDIIPPTPLGCNPNYGNPIVLQAGQWVTAPHENRPPYYALAFIMKLP